MNSKKLHLPKRSIKSSWFIRAIATGIYLWMIFLISGCDVLNPDEPIPAYLKIDQINLSVNPVTDGSASSKITDAWVYCDGELVGVFELPCKFPLLKDGAHDIIVKAGIKINGISASRGYYPFYTSFEQRINFIAGETYDLVPTVSYYLDKVQYKEGFEDGGISLEAFSDSDTTILKTNTDVFEGAYSGIINLNSTFDHVIIATSNAYDLPKTGTPVFLEMNYKASNPLIVGLVAIVSGSSQKIEIMTLNANESWNKIYINLTGITVANQNASNFKLYLEVYKDPNLTETIVLLDNLKLVYNE